MNWAWQMYLSPTQKLVLMALADAADDVGICWPSISNIARKCSISERTAQRIIAELVKAEVLISNARYKSDGSRTSNKYKLALGAPHDKLSPPPVNYNVPLRHRDATPHDSGDVVTTNITIIKPPLLQEETTADVETISVAGGSSDSEFYFPKQFTTKECDLAKRQLDSIDVVLAQEVLDELAARLNTNSVKSAPLSYLRSLISRAKAGQFTLEAGTRIAHTRQLVLLQKQAEIDKQNAQQKSPLNVSDIPKHLAAMHQALRHKSPTH